MMADDDAPILSYGFWYDSYGYIWLRAAYEDTLFGVIESDGGLMLLLPEIPAEQFISSYWGA